METIVETNEYTSFELLFPFTVDSLSRTRKGPTNLFEIEKVWDRENYRKNQNFY